MRAWELPNLSIPCLLLRVVTQAHPEMCRTIAPRVLTETSGAHSATHGAKEANFASSTIGRFT